MAPAPGTRFELLLVSALCPVLAVVLAIHHRLDWLNRFEDSTDVSPIGELRTGEIAVQDLAQVQR